MNIAILDDELHCVESLVIHIKNLFPNFRIVYKGNKVREALAKIPQMEIDLLFLDVEMPGLNGFQFLEQLSDRDFDVIFTTAYSQYAIDAFKINAINYLLKPIDEEELKEAIEEWEENRSKDGWSEKRIEELITSLKKEGMMKSKISVPVTDGYQFVEVQQIMYCKSQSNYTTLFLIDGSQLLISKTLKEIEKSLGNYFFLRVHQSFLINLNYLKRFSRSDGGYLVMTDDCQVPISNKKRYLINELFQDS